MPWLDDLIIAHRELESPAAFWKWAGLASISAIVQDKVWWDKFRYQLFPSVYVMYHAESGLKKGPPVALARKLVGKTIGDKGIIGGRSSIQGILKYMGTSETIPGGKVISPSNIFICWSELTSAIVSDPVATDILTDLYDRHYNTDHWRSLLKMETFAIKAPTVTMLSATNDAHINEFLASKDLRGGFLARTFIIHETKRQTINSLMFPPSNSFDEDKSVAYLKEIAKLKGPFEIDIKIRTYCDEWYKQFTHDRDLQEVKDTTGTLNRFDDSVYKVAMLLSLARAPELVITQQAIEEAIKECEKLIGSARLTSMGSSSNGNKGFAEQKSIFITELLNRDGNMISRRMMNKKYYLLASHEEWDQIALQLEVAGIISIQTSGGHQVVYVMPEKVVEEWRKHLGGKLK